MRFVWIIGLGILGAALVACALLVPSHLKAVDAQVLTAGNAGTPSLVEKGMELAQAGKIGPARIVLRVAQMEGLPGADRLEAAVRTANRPEWRPWGGPAPQLDQVFKANSRARQQEGRPVMELLIPRESRVELFDFLNASPKTGVRDLLRTRGFTNLVHFSPLASAAGQPYDAVTLLTALLLENLERPLRDAIESRAFAAVRRGEVAPLELTYLDIISLAKRLNWAQLTELLRRVDSLDALRDVANLARTRAGELPYLYSAALLAGSAEGVGRHLIEFGTTGIGDVKFALRSGQGAVRELARSGQRVYHPTWRRRVTDTAVGGAAFRPLLGLARWSSWTALGIKYGLLLGGAFVLALAMAGVTVEGRQTRPRIWLAASQWVFAACAAALVSVLTEPYLLEQSQRAEFPMYWKFPMVQGPVREAIQKVMTKQAIDAASFMSLLLFFILQLVTYLICRRKLVEIQRQEAPSKLKLKLLENEEHLFDAGLYLGFVGTVMSLVCVSLGIIKPSLMAAYSSTSFGIIFVSVLKIAHLRPFRKKLILDVEAGEAKSA